MATAEQLHAIRRENDFRPGRLLMLVRRHLWLIMGIGLGTLVLVVAYTLMATKVWEATASIRVDRSKTAAPVGDFTLETEINTEMAVLASRSLAEEAVDSLGLRAGIATPYGPVSLSWHMVRSHVLSSVWVDPQADTLSLILTQSGDSSYRVTREDNGDSLGVATIGHPLVLKGATFTLAAGVLDQARYELDIGDRTAAIDGLEKALNIDRPSRLGNLVSVAYRDQDPKLAKDLVDLVVRRFISRRQSQGQGTAQASVAFLRAQLDSLSKQLRLSEDSLREFRDRRHVVDLGVEATSGVNHLADLQAQRTDLSSERDALGQLLDEINKEGSTPAEGAPSPYRRLMAFPSLLKNQAAGQLLTSLAGLEDQRAQLLIRRTTADPDVQTIDQRIADLDGQLHSMAETYHSGLSNQIAAIDATIAKMNVQLAEVPGKELEAVRLERRPKVLGELYDLLQTRLKEAELATAAEEQDILLVDAASVPSKPVWPKKLINLAAGIVLGGAVGLLAAFAREYFDRSVHTRYDVQELTGVPVLGLIPRFPKVSKRLKKSGDLAKKNLVVGVNSEAGKDLGAEDGRDPKKMLVAGRRRLHGIAEAFGHLQTNLSFLGSEGGPRVIMITSPLPGDGKTTSATNLALILAQRGQRVVLIDADLRRGVINRAFSTSRSPGLTEALTGREPLEKAIWTVKTGEGFKLNFMPTGELPHHPAGLLGSEAMGQLLSTLASRYDVVLLDSAPVNAVTDSAVLAKHIDGVLVVARAGTTPLEALSFGLEQLRHVKAPIIGAILNDIDLKRDSAYDRVYQYYGAPEYTGAKG